MTKRHETPAEARERQMRRIKTEGVDAAIEALIGVCADPKAAAPAKSSAGTSLIRAAGFFDRRDPDEDLQPHEMTGEQLQRAIARLKLDSDALARGEAGEDGEEPDGEGGVFS